MTPWPVAVHNGAIERRFQLASDVVIPGRLRGPAGRTASFAIGRQPFPLKPLNYGEQTGKCLILPDPGSLVFGQLQPRAECEVELRLTA